MPKLRLGGIHMVEKEYNKAEPLLREALALFIQHSEEKPNHANLTRYAVARLSLEQGDYRAAKREAEKAMQIDRQTYGEGVPQLATGLAIMGNVECRMGRYAAAESYLREALRLRGLEKNQSPYTVSDIKAYIGECLTAQNRFEEAEPLLIESYDSMKPKQAPQSFRLKEAKHRLISLYERWNKPEMAARYRSQ